MKRRTKIGIIGGFVLVVGGLAAGGVAMRDDSTQVRMETVAERDLIATVTASGWIRPRRAVEIQADIMGRIIELPVEEGDTVKGGQLLLRIDPSQYEAAVAQARAGVSSALAQEAQARASLIQAERALDRARQMSARDSLLVSRQALEDAGTAARVQEALLEAARFGVERARAALKESEDRLAKTVIRAPMDGVVTRLNVEEGEMAIVGTMNNPGSLLMTVSDLSVMEAVVQVDETDVPQLQLGDSAAIEVDAFPDRIFSGRVTQIGHSAVNSPSLNRGAGNQAVSAIDFEVVITLNEPPPSLRPDLSASADIVTDTRAGVLTVPIIALTVREKPEAEALPTESKEARAAAAAAASPRDKDQEGVFLVRQGKAEFVPVTVGIAGQEHFEVLTGLAKGDTVVAGPYEAIRNLQPGKAVRSMDAQESAKDQTPKEGS